MKCAICKSGETRPGRTVAALTRVEFVIVFYAVQECICEHLVITT